MIGVTASNTWLLSWQHLYTLVSDMVPIIVGMHSSEDAMHAKIVCSDNEHVAEAWCIRTTCCMSDTPEKA